MESVERLINEVVASFRIDNIKVPPEVIYGAVKKIEFLFSENNNKGKVLVKKGNRNV